MKVSELIGPALDWAVAHCEGFDLSGCSVSKVCSAADPNYAFYKSSWDKGGNYQYMPSTNWYQGGPLIEKNEMSLIRYRVSSGPVFWEALVGFDGEPGNAVQRGPTMLIAAMRCLVASKFGDEIEVPEELK